MPSRSKISALVLLMIAAFAWGYKRDALLDAWASWKAAPSATDTSVGAPTGNASATLNPQPLQTGLAPRPFSGTGPGMGVAGQPVPPNVPPGYPGPGIQQPATNTLTNTLDSIRPGEIQPEQLTQRNAYFEKLSQQLRELQGGTPYPPGATPPPPDIPPPQVPGADALPFAPNMAPPPPPGVPQADFDQSPTDDREPEDQVEEELADDDSVDDELDEDIPME